MMLIGVSFLPPLGIVVALLFIGMMCLGAGNGSVFQLVPQRFAGEIGLVTGIVGAAGGLGGYVLPLILGRLYQATGSYAPGFIILSFIASASLTLTIAMQLKWRRSWLRGVSSYPETGSASLIAMYRDVPPEIKR